MDVNNLIYEKMYDGLSLYDELRGLVEKRYSMSLISEELEEDDKNLMSYMLARCIEKRQLGGRVSPDEIEENSDLSRDQIYDILSKLCGLNVIFRCGSDVEVKDGELIISRAYRLGYPLTAIGKEYCEQHPELSVSVF